MFFQPLRMSDVIAVHDGDEIAVAAGDCRIARRRQSGVVLADDFYARIAPRVFGKNRGGAVGGAIVDHDQFPIVQGLVQDAFHGIANIRRDIIRRHNHADRWLCLVFNHSRVLQKSFTSSYLALFIWAPRLESFFSMLTYPRSI